jgi:hypothetical protein
MLSDINYVVFDLGETDFGMKRKQSKKCSGQQQLQLFAHRCDGRRRQLPTKLCLRYLC